MSGRFTRREFLRRHVKSLATLAALTGAASYPLAVEPNLVTKTCLTLRIDGLPSAFDGFTVLHVTDMHTKAFGAREGAVAEIAREERPDLIVHTGDLVDKREGLEAAMSLVKAWAEVAPVIMVAGNWEHWSGVGSSGLKEVGESIPRVRVLNNEAILLERERSELAVVGVDDPYTGADDLNEALGGLGAYRGPTVLLAHSPQIIDEAREVVDVVLAGHTHGGQVRLPFLGPLAVPLPRRYRKYDQGLFVEGGTKMYVSRGVGLSVLPVRFMCPPEVVLIELKAA